MVVVLTSPLRPNSKICCTSPLTEVMSVLMSTSPLEVENLFASSPEIGSVPEKRKKLRAVHLSVNPRVKSAFEPAASKRT